MRPSVFPAHLLHARLSVACGEVAVGLLVGKGGDNVVVVALLAGAFVLRAYDNFEFAGVVFCPRFYGPSPDHLLLYVSLLFISLW